MPSVGGLLWVGVWTFPLLDPLSRISTTTTSGIVAGAGLGLFELAYVVVAALAFEHREDLDRITTTGFALVAALGVGLAAGYGEHWLIVMLFVATCGTAVYAGREKLTVAVAVLAAVLTTTLLLGLLHDALSTALITAVGATLSSGLCAAVRQMSRLIRELHTTREALATAAVAEERLRFSRDLHDLLGHTLSVIVVKAEVVRRIAERDPAAAAAQAADIEDIGRRALVEIREAVTGYRESGLTAELTRAKGVLSSAGITATVQRTADPLPEDADRLLAWVLREATTNVVRHSGAQRCDIEIFTADGTASIRVVDHGGTLPAAPETGSAFGNGLRGLTERLGVAGGTLEAGARAGGGFTLIARLPL